MKNSFLIALLFTVTAIAKSATAADCDNSNICTFNCGDDCTATLNKTNKTLELTGSGSMVEYERYHAPWYFWQADIETITLSNGLTSISRDAFGDMVYTKTVNLPETLTTIDHCAFNQNRALEKINLPASLTSIGAMAFSNTWKLSEINIPSQVQEIEQYAFTNSKIDTFVIPENIQTLSALAFFADGYDEMPLAHLYCPEALASQCAAAVAYRDDAVEVKTYQYKDGVYVLKDENGDDKYYLSADNMKRADRAETDEEKAQYTCADLNSCKANALKNRGLCFDLSGDCRDFVAADNAGRMLKVGSKTYQSLDALLKGDFDRRRIYTVDEANFVAGKKNSIKIRYK